MGTPASSHCLYEFRSPLGRPKTTNTSGAFLISGSPWTGYQNTFPPTSTSLPARGRSRIISHTDSSPWDLAMWIDRLVRFLLPRQDFFFDLFEQIAAKMTTSAEVFGELATASGHEQFEAIAARMKPIET